ncbi:MAG TPA: DUF2461 domain-containing protein [Bacteroidia bacterium]|jgi:uncharacterized protein (TIGR02453 family)|nr:DUF2461 domain-containing protein [Bacteroidia bacterium]
MKPSIPESVFTFLKDLKKNNNREWFSKHKARYTEAHENMIVFADALLSEMNRHDLIETPSGKKSLYRIYNDVRFSKDKSPYKSSWSGGFRRATKQRRGGYYFHLEAGNSYAAGGFFNPNPEDLARIRQEIAGNAKEFRAVLKSKEKVFGTLRGECLKKAPSGYSTSDPAIDLLRYKQFILKRTFTDAEVKSPAFLGLLNTTFRHMRPFFDHMSEVLTTDSNGSPLE